MMLETPRGQRIAKKMAALVVIIPGIIIALWGLGQSFQGKETGFFALMFGVLVIVAGYALWKQA